MAVIGGQSLIGGGVVGGMSIDPGKRPTPTFIQPSPGNQGSVLGSQVGPSQAAGSPGAPSNLLLQEPSGGPADLNIAPALSALGQRESDIGRARETTLNEIQQQAGKQRGVVESGRERQIGELTQQTEREKGRGESAISEARRQAAEIQQGIQARFGGTTGTGQFAGEILGREALRNISGNRQALNQALTQIEGERQRVEEESSTLLRNIEEETSLATEKSRNFFQEQLTQIAGLRGELESRKSEFRARALQDHQARLDSIRSDNVNFQRKIFSDFQAKQQKLQGFASQAVQDVQASLSPADFLRAVALGADTGSFPQDSVPQEFQGVGFSTKSTRDDEELSPTEELLSGL